MQWMWEKVVRFLRQNLNLRNLTLSINAGGDLAIDQWNLGEPPARAPAAEGEQQEEEEDTDSDWDEDENGRQHSRLTINKRIIVPLRGLGEEKDGLAKFYAFWEYHHGYEAQTEKEVMGPAYEAVNKLPVSRRDPRNPWWDLEWEKEKGE